MQKKSMFAWPQNVTYGLVYLMVSLLSLGLISDSSIKTRK